MNIFESIKQSILNGNKFYDFKDSKGRLISFGFFMNNGKWVVQRGNDIIVEGVTLDSAIDVAVYIAKKKGAK